MQNTNSTEVRTCLIIINCRKNSDRRQRQLDSWLKSYPYELWFHVVGDDSIQSPYELKDRVLTVKCGDDYMSLPRKIFLASLAVYETFPSVTHLIKTDDDMDCNFAELEAVVGMMPKFDYGGHMVNSGAGYSSTYHYPSVAPADRVPQLCRGTLYARGCFYFLSRLCMRRILDSKEVFWTSAYEDNAVGFVVCQIPSLRVLAFKKQTVFFNPLETPQAAPTAPRESRGGPAQ